MIPYPRRSRRSGMNVVSTEFGRNDRHYFLYRALEPLKPFLDDPRIVEVSINRPGHVYVERLGDQHMAFFSVPELTTAENVNIGDRVADSTNQYIVPDNAILGAASPTGY